MEKEITIPDESKENGERKVTVTFGESVTETILENFDFSIGDDGYIRRDGKKVLSIKGNPILKENFAGFGKYKGEVVLVSKNYVDIYDWVRLENNDLDRKVPTYEIRE